MDKLCKYKKIIHRKLINGQIILLNAYVLLLTIHVVRRSDVPKPNRRRARRQGRGRTAGEAVGASVPERRAGRRRRPRLLCEAVFSPSMVRRRGVPETAPVGGGPGPLSPRLFSDQGTSTERRGRIDNGASLCAGPGRLQEASGVPLRRRVTRASQDPRT